MITMHRILHQRRVLLWIHCQEKCGVEQDPEDSISHLHQSVSQSVSFNRIQSTDSPVSSLLAFISVAQDVQVETPASYKKLNQLNSSSKTPFSLLLFCYQVQI